MKFIRSLSLALLLSSVCLTGCEQDSYDSGTGPNSLLQADFVELSVNSEKRIYQAETDNGTLLSFDHEYQIDWVEKGDTSYRAVLYYNLTGGNGTCRPISASQIPTLEIIPPHQVKEMKTDPVKLESAWLSKQGKYLNMGLYIMTSETTEESPKQKIAIINDSIRTNTGGKRIAHLTFYHDQNSIPEYYSKKLYVSILCDSLDCDSICLHINTYQGIWTKTF